MRSLDTGRRSVRARSNGFTRGNFIGRRGLADNIGLKPREEFGQCVFQKSWKGWERRELVPEHVFPRAFKNLAMGFKIDTRQGNRDALVFALLAKDIQKRRRVPGRALELRYRLTTS